MDFQTEEIKVSLKTQPVDYGENCLPKDKEAYQRFNQEHKNRPKFDIWEKSIPNGQGFLGVINKKGDTIVEGSFKTYTHKGSYSKLMEICKNIATSNPNIVEFYCVYLNSPEEVSENDLKTKIIFRQSN